MKINGDMTMDPKIKTDWLEALRSGEFTQGRGALQRDGEFCCLGVLCELAVRAGVAIVAKKTIMGVYYAGIGNVDADRCFLPDPIRVWAGLDEVAPLVRDAEDGFPVSLAALNDTSGTTFAMIAERIEECL